jgi:hypothetical protein
MPNAHPTQAQMAPEQWRLITRDPDYVLGTWQQIFAVIWRKETTLHGAIHLRNACTEFASRHPQGIGLLTIVEPNSPLPASDIRKSIADFLHDGSSFIKCSTVIFEGSGFRAAAVRSVVTGLTLMARQAYPHRVCSLVEASHLYGDVLSAATGQVVVAEQFRSTLAEFRGRINER